MEVEQGERRILLISIRLWRSTIAVSRREMESAKSVVIPEFPQPH